MLEKVETKEELIKCIRKIYNKLQILPIDDKTKIENLSWVKLKNSGWTMSIKFEEDKE